MFQRSAALPLAFSSLFLLACDEGGDDVNAGTEGSTGEPTSTTDGATSDPGTTTAPGTTAEPGTTTGGSTSGAPQDESSTGFESSSSAGDGSSSTGEEAIGIADAAGTYIETFGPGKTDFQTHIVTAADWTINFGEFGMAVMTYEEVDDVERWVAGDDGAGTYTRYDWDFDDDGNLRYCVAIFEAETIQDAINAPPSNRDDFDGTGCAGSFPWSLLVLED